MKKAICRALKCFYTINLITLLFFSQVVFADGETEGVSVSYNGKNKTVTVIANAATYENAAAIITISKDEENTIVNIVRTDSNGVVTCSEIIPDGFDGGRYNVKVSTKEKTLTGYFIYPIAEEIESVLPTLNEKTTWEALCQALKENSDPLAIDRLIFDPISEKASQILFSQKPENGWIKSSDFLYSYSNALAAVGLNAGTNPEQIFLKYGAALNFDVSKYVSLNNVEKEKIDTYLKNVNYTTILVTDAFYEGKAISQILASGSWDTLLSKIDDVENNAVLKLDTTYFDKLVNTDLAYQNLFNELNGDENIDDIRALYVEVTKACYEKENESGPTSSSKDSDIGNGGFSGGTTKPQENPPEPTIPKEDDPVTVLEFPDMTEHWSKDVVSNLASRGIIGGFPDGTFRPDEGVTRAQFTAMIVRALGISSDEKCGFTDVENNSWYVENINAAVNAGIINGMGNGMFFPDEYIKRQDAILIIYRAFNDVLKDVEDNNFVDNGQVSDYAKDAVNVLFANEIVKGNDKGEVKPLDNISRAEVATILVRILEIEKE